MLKQFILATVPLSGKTPGSTCVFWAKRFTECSDGESEPLLTAAIRHARLIRDGQQVGLMMVMPASSTYRTNYNAGYMGTATHTYRSQEWVST